MKTILTLSLNYLYLDWVNNYTTIDRFAEHYDITTQQASELIYTLRGIYEDAVTNNTDRV